MNSEIIQIILPSLQSSECVRMHYTSTRTAAGGTHAALTAPAGNQTALDDRQFRNRHRMSNYQELKAIGCRSGSLV